MIDGFESRKSGHEPHKTRSRCDGTSGGFAKQIGLDMTTTSSSLSIIQHDPVADALSPGTLRDLRFLRTEDLESENRYLRECRQDVIDDGGDGIQFEPTIVAISNELERRRQRLNRCGNDILRPDWPNMHEKR